MSHPDDEKYRKIRLYNKAFQERVAHIEGALMFLEAIGFEKKCLPHEGKDEEFYVLPNQVSCDSLNTYKELLLSTEPVTPSLHHNPQLYEVAGRYNRFELPNSFYNMSLEEIKREQKLKYITVIVSFHWLMNVELLNYSVIGFITSNKLIYRNKP
jgi:UBX domain-containing protein 6